MMLVCGDHRLWSENGGRSDKRSDQGNENDDESESESESDGESEIDGGGTSHN